MAKDVAFLERIGSGLPAPSAIFMPWLPSETAEMRVAAAIRLSEAGYEPVLHVAARHVRDRRDLERFLTALSASAGVRRLLLIGGDRESPAGPFSAVLQIIESGLLEASGICTVGIAGHPDGHPAVEAPVMWQALQEKCEALARRGIGAEIVTQFSFDARAVLAWIVGLRARGITLPVAVGLPGPAGVITLMRYAALCGVGASANAVAKYGFSLAGLIDEAGPEQFLKVLTRSLSRGTTGSVRAHVLPIGGLRDTAHWLRSVSCFPEQCPPPISPGRA